MKAYLRPSVWRLGLRLLATWWSMPRRIDRSTVRELLHAADAGARAQPRSAQTLDDVRDLVYWVAYRARLPVTNTCLVRSLAVYQTLREAGEQPEIVFAVRPEETIQEGHCWLEINGSAYLEPDEKRRTFTPIFRHPSDEH